MFDALLAEFTTPFRVMPVEVAGLRLLASMVLGGIIGLERKLAACAAALHTPGRKAAKGDEDPDAR